jgi:hypothetical protein
MPSRNRMSCQDHNRVEEQFPSKQDYNCYPIGQTLEQSYQTSTTHESALFLPVFNWQLHRQDRRPWHFFVHHIQIASSESIERKNEVTFRATASKNGMHHMAKKKSVSLRLHDRSEIFYDGRY